MIFIKYIIIFFLLILLAVPFSIGYFIKNEFFSFSGGSTDSWVSFWGSYGGAIIGAITVYLVTTLQNKNQKDLQLESIKREHDNAINRENRNVYLNKQGEKIEETLILLDELIDLTIFIGNSFRHYSIFKENIEKEDYGDKKEIVLMREKYKKEVLAYYQEITVKLSPFSRAYIYIDDIYIIANQIDLIITTQAMLYKNGVEGTDISKLLEESVQKNQEKVLDRLLKQRKIIKNTNLIPKLKAINDERKALGGGGIDIKNEKATKTNDSTANRKRFKR